MRSADAALLGALGGLLATTVTGCGEPNRVEHPNGRLSDESGPKVARPDAVPIAEADVGAMSEYDVAETFKQAHRGVVRCLERASQDRAYLAGDIEVTLRIAKGGRVVDALPSRSTLGDRGAERCILDLLAGRTWPSPVGGKIGIVRQEFSVQSRGRSATTVAPGQLGKTLGAARGRLASCGSGDLAVTVYLDADGKVVAAGAATKEPAMKGELDCAAEALADVPFPSPGSFFGKVTIQR